MTSLNFLHQHPAWFATCIVGVLVVAAAFACLAWRKRKSPHSGNALQGLEISTPRHLPPLVPSSRKPWLQPPQGGGGVSKDWSDFVRDRLDELDPSACQDDTKWALGIVDFLDELKEADAEASAVEQTKSASLRASLLSVLSYKGYEPVDSDEWNPDKQRAVSVVRNLDAAGTRILGKGSTGLSRNGKIIRKQEVKIEMKGN